MVRKSLLVVALLAIATPALAQEAGNVWSSKRPDAQAPVGVVGGRTLELGQVEFTYRYNRLTSTGIWFDNVMLSPDFVGEYYQVVPLSLVSEVHSLGVAVAASEDLTLMANLGYTLRERDQVTNDYEFWYFTNTEELTDLEISGLYRVYDQGPYRAHLHFGASIPTGTYDVKGKTVFSTPGEENLTYDMRAGAGTFGAMPGITMAAQNDVATVGAQLKGTIYFGTNDQDFAPGNRMEFNAWAAYKASDYFAVTARAAYQDWGAIEGADPAAKPRRDPGYDGLGLGGHRLDIPVGISLYMPEGTRFAGHRLSVEYIYPASHKYDGPQLAADWGLVAAWQVVF